MPGPQDFLFGVLLPAILAGLVLLLVWGRRAAAPASRRGRAAGAFALGLGYLAAHLYLFRGLVVPSADRVLAARDWIPWVVVVALALATLRLARPVRHAVDMLGGALCVALIAWLSVRNQLGRSVSWLDFAGALLVLLGAWASAEALARRVPGAGVPLALWVVATATSVCALLASGASTAQIAGALAATLGAAVVLAWWNPRLELAGGGVTVALVLIAACLLNATFFATLPRTSAVLLALGLVTPWLASLPWFDALGAGSKAVVRAVCAALPCAAAVALAKLAEPEPYF